MRAVRVGVEQGCVVEEDRADVGEGGRPARVEDGEPDSVFDVLPTAHEDGFVQAEGVAAAVRWVWRPGMRRPMSRIGRAGRRSGPRCMDKP